MFIFIGYGMKNFKNLVTLGCLGILLSACTGARQNVTTDVSTAVAPGSAADFNQNVTNTVYFGFDKYNLTQEATDVLDQVAMWLRQYSDKNVVIEGRTDKRGSQDYNLALGNRRADSAKKFLTDHGIDQNRISTISYGKKSLIAEGDSEQDHAINRQARIVIAE